MQMMKHAAAEAKEKLGNGLIVKVEEKMDNAKASATEETDKAMVHNKAGKLEAKERKHERQAEAQQAKDLKQVENAREVGQAKEDVAGSKAASHVAHHKQATELSNATRRPTRDSRSKLLALSRTLAYLSLLAFERIAMISLVGLF